MKYIEISMTAKICFKDETSVEEIEGIKRLVVNDKYLCAGDGFNKI